MTDDIKQACVEALVALNGRVKSTYEDLDRVNAVLDTLIARTPSPRTVDELVRIRGDAS